MLIRARRYIFRGAPPAEFKRWANESPAPSDAFDVIMFGTRKHRQGRTIVDRNELRSQLLHNPHPQRLLVISKEQPHGQVEPSDMLCFAESDIEHRIQLNEFIFEINAKYREPCIICNMAVRRLRFVGDMKTTIRLINCWVERFSIHPQSRLNIEIIDSHIAHWELQDGCCDNFTMQNSSLGSVSRAGGTARAIVGNARFEQVFTPRGSSWYKQGDAADQWAQAKRELVATGNEWAAGIFHAAEMSIRTKQDASCIIRFIGGFYEDACDFGNSIARPVLWSGVVFILAFITYWLLDSPFDAPNVDACRGWIEGLCREGWSGRLSRAFYLGIQPMLNPLAGIVGVPVMIPGFPAYVYSIFHRILSFVLIFLMIVAIRRRFRLTGE